jgi:ribosomal protein S18 acetylase RimI-like enzyme
MPILIRHAEPGDAAAIARVHVATWQTTYAGIIPEGFLASLRVEDRISIWQQQLADPKSAIFVAELVAGQRQEVCGFISGGELREPIAGYQAELYAIYLLAQEQRQGTGQLLIQELVRSLLAAHLEGLLVWVLEQNSAVEFYKHLGATPVAKKEIQIGGVALQEIALGWREMNRLIPFSH